MKLFATNRTHGVTVRTGGPATTGLRDRDGAVTIRPDKAPMFCRRGMTTQAAMRSRPEFVITHVPAMRS